jgi:hypothetical protein
MNLPDRPAIRAAYEAAVVALLNTTHAPKRTEAAEERAEAFVDAMAELIFTTMQTYLSEKESNAVDHH